MSERRSMTKRCPIGVFDSGIGGLSVVRALMECLPCESIVYFGDTARLPYGSKSIATIETFTRKMVRFLLSYDVKALVIACNTISAVAQHVVKEVSGGEIPVFDVISAGAEAAVASSSQHQCMGVIATSATVHSQAYVHAIHRTAPHIRVISQACPLLVPLVEEGYLNHPATRLVAEEYLRPLQQEGIETLVLGCTHYPLLKPLLSEILGESVTLVDAAVTTANKVAEYLTKHNLRHEGHDAGCHEFCVSDVPGKFQSIGEEFLGRSMGTVKHVSLDS